MDKKTWPAGVRPWGNGIQIRIWENGRQVYSETLEGDPYKKSDLTAAVKRRNDILARRRLGLSFAQDAAPNEMPFEEVAQNYLTSLDAKFSTSTSYENIINRYWLPEFSGWPMAEITSYRIKEILAKYKALSPKTRKNMLIPLRGILDYAEINPNPVNTVKIRKEQKQAIHRYTPQERDLLLSTLDAQERVYFTLLFGTGLRPGEALALKWSDYSGSHLNISKQITRRRFVNSTKTSVRRTVYVPKWVRPVLNNHPTRFQGDYIFVNTKGGPYLDTDVFNEAWQRAHKKKRIPYRIPYTCRHTRAAELLSLGVNPADAAQQMGHSAEMFFRIYSEWIEEYARDQDEARFEPTALTARRTQNGG